MKIVTLLTIGVIVAIVLLDAVGLLRWYVSVGVLAVMGVVCVAAIAWDAIHSPVIEGPEER